MLSSGSRFLRRAWSTLMEILLLLLGSAWACVVVSLAVTTAAHVGALAIRNTGVWSTLEMPSPERTCICIFVGLEVFVLCFLGAAWIMDRAGLLDAMDRDR